MDNLIFIWKRSIGGSQIRAKFLSENLSNSELIEIENFASNRYRDLKILNYIIVIIRLRTYLKNRDFKRLICFGIFPTKIVFWSKLFSFKRGLVHFHEITTPLLALRYSRFGIRKYLDLFSRFIYYNLCEEVSANSLKGVSEVSMMSFNKNVLYFPPVLVQKTSQQEMILNKYVLAYGRLIVSKRFDLLIRCYSKSSQKLPLYIVGDGPERIKLVKLVEKLKLETRVFIFSSETDVLNKFVDALFVFHLSLYEGMSNAVLESIFGGRICVISYGSSELIYLKKHLNDILYFVNTEYEIIDLFEKIFGFNFYYPDYNLLNSFNPTNTSLKVIQNICNK